MFFLEPFLEHRFGDFLNFCCPNVRFGETLGGPRASENRALGRHFRPKSRLLGFLPSEPISPGAKLAPQSRPMAPPKTKLAKNAVPRHQIHQKMLPSATKSIKKLAQGKRTYRKNDELEAGAGTLSWKLQLAASARSCSWQLQHVTAGASFAWHVPSNVPRISYLNHTSLISRLSYLIGNTETNRRSAEEAVAHRSADPGLPERAC